MNNPLDALKIFLGNTKNPKEIIQQMIKNNQNPMIDNLIKMAETGNYKGVEEFARNMFKEQGRDFDTEMQQLQNLVKNFK